MITICVLFESFESIELTAYLRMSLQGLVLNMQALSCVAKCVYKNEHI